MLPYGCQSIFCNDKPQSCKTIYFFPEEGRHPCPVCKQPMARKNIIHLVQLNPNGTIPASKMRNDQTEKFGFVCERSKQLERDGTRPSFYTIMPESSSCYECLKKVKHDLGKDKDKPVKQFKLQKNNFVE